MNEFLAYECDAKNCTEGKTCHYPVSEATPVACDFPRHLNRNCQLCTSKFAEKLVTLSLNGNWLERVPPEIGKCQALRFLNLQTNHLTELPDEIAQLVVSDACSTPACNWETSLRFFPPKLGASFQKHARSKSVFTKKFAFSLNNVLFSKLLHSAIRT